MTKIKICGITNRADALAAVDLSVDAVGFVFYPQSPRYIAPDSLEQFRRKISPSTRCIGVFVNERKESVLRIAKQCRLDGLQFHGNESPEYCSHFSTHMVIKAFALKNRKDLRSIKDYNVQAILVDTYDSVNLGGTGKKSNWELAEEARSFGPLILAGGLNETTVKDAIRSVNPFAVDVSSGLEISPGAKNHDKMNAFVQKVREIERPSVNQYENTSRLLI